MFDCTVIGGGPGGYRAAELMGKSGLSVALVEEKNLGGTCLNEGCIPFKSYLHSSMIRSETEKLLKTKIAMGTGIVLNQQSVFRNKEMIVKGLRQSIGDMLNSCGVKIFYGHARITENTGDYIRIDANGEDIESKLVVIATGSNDSVSFHNLQDAAGYQILDSHGLLELTSVPGNIDIIGGGAIGLEAASFLIDSGCEVTLIEASHTIGGHIDTEIADVLKKILQKKGIKIFTDTSLLEFGRDRVTYRQGNEFIFRTPQAVLTAMGRKPNIDEGLLCSLGIKYDANGIEIDDRCRTSNPKVYACGDVTGKMMLAHVAYHQAKVIADTICGRETRTNYNVIPRVIYSNPEVMSIGVSEDDCRKQGIGYISRSLPMTYCGKYFAENGKDGAKAKMIVDSGHHIIGFHMIGNGASEISLAAELMLLNNMTYESIGKLTIAHPTYCEILSELAGSF